MKDKETYGKVIEELKSLVSKENDWLMSNYETIDDIKRNQSMRNIAMLTEKITEAEIAYSKAEEDEAKRFIDNKKLTIEEKKFNNEQFMDNEKLIIEREKIDIERKKLDQAETKIVRNVRDIDYKEIIIELGKVIIPAIISLKTLSVWCSKFDTMVKFEETGRFVSTASRELHLPKILK